MLNNERRSSATGQTAAQRPLPLHARLEGPANYAQGLQLAWDVNMPFPTREATMYLSSLGGEQAATRPFVRDVLQVDDIEGARPHAKGYDFSDKPEDTKFLDHTRQLHGRWMRNKPFHCLSNHDIPGTQPRKRGDNITDSKRRVDPLCPKYVLPTAVESPATPPRFVRDSMAFFDQDPRMKRHVVSEHMTTKPSSTMHNVEGGYPVASQCGASEATMRQMRQTAKPRSLSVADIGFPRATGAHVQVPLGGGSQPRRQHERNPLEPVYAWGTNTTAPPAETQQGTTPGKKVDSEKPRACWVPPCRPVVTPFPPAAASVPVDTAPAALPSEEKFEAVTASSIRGPTHEPDRRHSAGGKRGSCLPRPAVSGAVAKENASGGLSRPDFKREQAADGQSVGPGEPFMGTEPFGDNLRVELLSQRPPEMPAGRSTWGPGRVAESTARPTSATQRSEFGSSRPTSGVSGNLPLSTAGAGVALRAGSDAPSSCGMGYPAFDEPFASKSRPYSGQASDSGAGSARADQWSSWPQCCTGDQARPDDRGGRTSWGRPPLPAGARKPAPASQAALDPTSRMSTPCGPPGQLRASSCDARPRLQAHAFTTSPMPNNMMGTPLSSSATRRPQSAGSFRQEFVQPQHGGTTGMPHNKQQPQSSSTTTRPHSAGSIRREFAPRHEASGGARSQRPNSAVQRLDRFVDWN